MEKNNFLTKKKGKVNETYYLKENKDQETFQQPLQLHFLLFDFSAWSSNWNATKLAEFLPIPAGN